MMRLVACVTLGTSFLVTSARAGEIVEYKGATLIRQEDHGLMVFEVKDGEIKATPAPAMKGVDLNGKVYSSGFAAAEKHEMAMQLLKVGNQLDIKINKANAKTFYIYEARLVKGEVFEWGATNKVEKADAKPADEIGAKPDDKTAKDAKTTDETNPSEKRPAPSKSEMHSYSKATIKSYEKKTVTFEVKGEQISAELAFSFKAIDSHGRVLKKDERFRVFNEGNEAMISTTKKGDKEVITDVKLTKGDLTDK
jgi:hypothetical protein